MKRTTVFMLCLTCAALAFYIGVTAGAFAVSEAGDQRHPPAGEQFDEGPVIVRSPGSQSTTRFIF